MDSYLFVRIIKEFFVLFVQQNFPNGNYLLQQDNDPKHVSKYTTEKFREMNIKATNWPAESPDLNCIEDVWHQLKEHLRGSVKPNNLEQLVAGIREFWKLKMTVEQCQRYIMHVSKVVPKVLAADGGPTLE